MDPPLPVEPHVWDLPASVAPWASRQELHTVYYIVPSCTLHVLPRDGRLQPTQSPSHYGSVHKRSLELSEDTPPTLMP